MLSDKCIVAEWWRMADWFNLVGHSRWFRCSFYSIFRSGSVRFGCIDIPNAINVEHGRIHSLHQLLPTALCWTSIHNNNVVYWSLYDEIILNFPAPHPSTPNSSTISIMALYWITTNCGLLDGRLSLNGLHWSYCSRYAACEIWPMLFWYWIYLSISRYYCRGYTDTISNQIDVDVETFFMFVNYFALHCVPGEGGDVWKSHRNITFNK